MAMRFTSEEALEYSGTEDAIMLNIKSVNRICEEHGLDSYDFFNDTYPNHNPASEIDAGELFAWLGY
jgi:hypothetical protein